MDALGKSAQRRCHPDALSLSPQIGPSTGNVSANSPRPASHPCVSTLPPEGPSVEVREEPGSSTSWGCGAGRPGSPRPGPGASGKCEESGLAEQRSPR